VRRFNELHEEFREAGVEVLGASVDVAERNAEFREQESLVFRLHSDPTKRLAAELGILAEIGDRGQLAARTTYLLDRNGTILKLWQVGPGEAIDVHPDEVLAEVGSRFSDPTPGQGGEHRVPATGRASPRA
jgi:peroxiredoxin Q/BCP